MKRKSLSEQDIESAHRLKEIWNNRKAELGLTQDRAAEILGFSTQGAVSHYLNAKTPLNLEAVLKFANLLQVPPELIRPEFSDLLSIARQLTPNAVEKDEPQESVEEVSSSVTANTTYRIKLVMKETGLSQAELARRIGVAQQTVQKWVHGISSPTTTNMDKLSDVTGRPPYWFMLPPDEGDQVVTPDTMKIGPKQRELLQTFNAFPEENQEKILREMKEERERKEKEVELWIKAKKGKIA